MRNTARSERLRVLGIVLIIAGIALLVVGIVYYSVPADKLPSFLGHIANSTKHHTKRALVGVVGGAVSLAAGALAITRAR